MFSDPRSFFKLYKEDFDGKRVQIWVMLEYLEPSWHAERQALSLKSKVFDPKMYPLAAFDYNAKVSFNGIEIAASIRRQ